GRRRFGEVRFRPNRLLVQSSRPIQRGGTGADRSFPGPIPHSVGQADRRRQGLRRGGTEIQ
ncbi:LOW QUALITY PROTEIN: sn-glycerol-3-phosphate-binding lipoprotein ugpB, partial [Mycobacterium tuberculosis T85]